MPKPLSERVSSVGGRSLIRAMRDYAAEPGLGAELRRKGIERVIDLGQGMPPFPLPGYVKEDLAYLITDTPGINRYTLQPGLPELREAVAKKIGGRPEDVYISAGSMAGLNQAVAAIVNRGDEVILTDPHYEPMRHVTLFYEGVPVYVPLIEGEGWRPDIQKLEDSVTGRTKLMVVNTPANPTGNVLAEDELREIARIAMENDVYVVCDEAYGFLTYGGNHVSMASLEGAGDEMGDLLVTCCTASKEEAMTGFRVGYVHTRNRRLFGEMLKVHDIQSICAPSVSQYAALCALTGPREHVEKFRNNLDKRRKLLRECAAAVPDFDYVEPRGAYYAFARYNRGMGSLDYSMRLLRELGVVTIPGETFGSLGEGHVRISFAATPEDIEEGMKRIKDFQERIA